MCGKQGGNPKLANDWLKKHKGDKNKNMQEYEKKNVNMSFSNIDVQIVIVKYTNIFINTENSRLNECSHILQVWCITAARSNK